MTNSKITAKPRYVKNYKTSELMKMMKSGDKKKKEIAEKYIKSMTKTVQTHKKYNLRREDYTIDELTKMLNSKDKKIKEFAEKHIRNDFFEKSLTGPETEMKKQQRKKNVKVSLQQPDFVLKLNKNTNKKLPTFVVPKGVKLMPTSGYEPRFVKLWGSQKRYIEANNCYAYAANQFRFWRPHKAQPGENRLKVHNTMKYVPLTCKDITKAVIRDAGNGAYKCNDPNKSCGKGMTKIMMVISPEPGAQDFHFYRQDKDGTWSHKQGWGYGPTKLDASGKVITDPRTCNRNYGRLNYSKVCSTMCIPKHFKYNI